ncbi:MAG: 2-dehydro-3-deoxygalactonokinase [Burkholderiaceae bacterium]
MIPPVLLGVDWGTSRFRAYLVVAAGAVLARIETGDGILSVAPGGFETLFHQRLQAWLAQWPTLPVVLSGMITSRNGWLELDYQALPADGDSLAGAMRAHPVGNGRLLHFVPGLADLADDRAPDVMRGEETQLLGLLSLAPALPARVLLPGTHSKWARIGQRGIEGFRTYMTGECYAVLREHSILGRLMRPGAADPAAFDKGLNDRRSGAASLLQQLFAVRTLGLFERMPATDLADYLSGLLIGDELAAALAGDDDSPVHLVGSGPLVARYRRALEVFGVSGRVAGSDLAVLGQLALARKRGLVR